MTHKSYQAPSSSPFTAYIYGPTCHAPSITNHIKYSDTFKTINLNVLLEQVLIGDGLYHHMIYNFFCPLPFPGDPKQQSVHK
jgi:hypothetical protein